MNTEKTSMHQLIDEIQSIMTDLPFESPVKQTLKVVTQRAIGLLGTEKQQMNKATIAGVEHGKSIMAWYQLNGHGIAPLTPKSFSDKYYEQTFGEEKQ